MRCKKHISAPCAAESSTAKWTSSFTRSQHCKVDFLIHSLAADLGTASALQAASRAVKRSSKGQASCTVYIPMRSRLHARTRPTVPAALACARADSMVAQYTNSEPHVVQRQAG